MRCKILFTIQRYSVQAMLLMRCGTVFCFSQIHEANLGDVCWYPMEQDYFKTTKMVLSIFVTQINIQKYNIPLFYNTFPILKSFTLTLKLIRPQLGMNQPYFVFSSSSSSSSSSCKQCNPPLLALSPLAPSVNSVIIDYHPLISPTLLIL